MFPGTIARKDVSRDIAAMVLHLSSRGIRSACRADTATPSIPSASANMTKSVMSTWYFWSVSVLVGSGIVIVVILGVNR